MLKAGDRVSDINNLQKVGTILSFCFDHNDDPYYNIEWDSGEKESLYVWEATSPMRVYQRDYDEESI